MSQVSERNVLLRFASTLPEDDETRKQILASVQDWKLNFPSHSGRDQLDRLYDRIFSPYMDDLRRDRDPALQEHKELMAKAMSTFVTLLAQIKNAERALYAAQGRTAEEKWIQDAVKRPGALHKALGIPEDQDIPIGKIRSELAKLKKKTDKTDAEKRLQDQLNFALTMKTKVNKSARFRARDVQFMAPEVALDELRVLSREAGRTAKERLDQYRSTAWEAERQADKLERAWDKWDWNTLADFGVVTEDEADFALEVLANYTP